MNLDISKWKEFKFGDLISDIHKAKAINKDDLTIATDNENSIRYITRTGENNGCELLADVREIDKKMIENGNAITIGDTTATCFYQEEDFITGDHMVVVRADFWLNPYTAMFVLAILSKENYKYSYGRAYIMDRIKDTIIKLPYDSSGNPDWKYMEEYIKSLRYKSLTTINKKGQVPNLKVSEWKEFRVGELFELEPTKGIVTEDLIEGYDVPYMAAKHEGNGVEKFCSKEGVEDWISKGNCIVFVNIGAGSAGYANYINEDFIGMSGKTTCGYNINLNKYNGLFVSTCLCLERPKYSFGRSWTGERLKETIIRLPVDSNGNPDWKFMENYIKKLPYGDRL